jgi:hypothetical protein
MRWQCGCWKWTTRNLTWLHNSGRSEINEDMMMAKQKTEAPKAPRLDVGAATIEADRPTLMARLDEMQAEAEPPKDNFPTNEQLNAELWHIERRKADMRAMNPREVLAEQRRQARIGRAGRFADGTRERQLLEIEARALGNVFTSFGQGVAPEITGRINAFVEDLDADIQAAVEQASIEAALGVIMQKRLELPQFRDANQADQNAYLQRIADERDRLEEIEATKSAAGMSPELCMERMRRAGITLRLDADGKLEAAPTNRIDKRIRALLRINAPGLTALLQEQTNFAKVG